VEAAGGAAADAEGAVQAPDRIGIGWRPALAAAILAHLDQIDVVEIIADDHFGASARDLRALDTLAREAPVVLHGIGLGLASCVAVEGRRLEAMARLVDRLHPLFWSEHLAFVRGGGREIGHLAAPPRVEATIEGTASNVVRARSVVGASPLLENVATLIDPPGSDRDEISWIRQTCRAADVGLLLDLHNLHANAVNFGFDALATLDGLPLDRVVGVHLAGGRWISWGEHRRLLDDHLHDVPDAVFHLLEAVGTRAPRPMTVGLERDGAFPPMEHLLAELARARHALAVGRARRPRAAS